MLGQLARVWQTRPEKDWKSIAQRKQQNRLGLLPTKWTIDSSQLPADSTLDVTRLCDTLEWLNQEELAITGLSVVELAAAIRDGKYSSTTVIEAYAHRATIAQQLVNPLTEINFIEAAKEAERLDEHLKKTGQVVGPLHGVPISLKDQFHVKGLDTTMGYCAWADSVASEDSVLVKCLKEAGAIILTKTNVAQALMMYESINLVFGRTLNPYNRSLTSGGSSGGEAALLAMRGSAIGVGSDYGGSIRAPSTYCGLYGLRPSWGRVSFKDASEAFAGMETRHATAGPMGHSPEDLDLFMSSYMAAKPWNMDPSVLHMPWRSMIHEISHTPLCFAVSYGDEEVTPHPPIVRGLDLVVDKLRQAGHIVVEWQGPLRTGDLLDVGGEFTLSGAREDILNSVKSTKEPIYPEIANGLGVYDKPRYPVQTPYSIWQLQAKKQALIDWFHETWQSSSSYSTTGCPVDGLIMPVNVCVATPHAVDTPTSPQWRNYGFADCAAILDITSAAFPTGLRQDPGIDVPVKDFKPKSDEDKRLQDLYGKPEQWAGAPIGLQIVGQRLEEEKVIGMLCRIRDALETR